MPSEVRKRFGNNPGVFMDFVSNPDNKEELVKLGLAVKPKVVEEVIQKVRIIEEKKRTDPEK